MRDGFFLSVENKNDKVCYNHKRAESENLFSFSARAVIIYPKIFATYYFRVYTVREGP